MWKDNFIGESEISGSSRGGSSNDDDWKSRIVSNGQWLGEKVLQLATRSHNTIPDNQRTMNDGRANWMAEIRNNARPGGNSSSYSNSSYNAGGYQNDFATERPGQYSDSYRPTSTYSDNPSSYSASASSGPLPTHKKSGKTSKSLSNNKKHKSKSSRRPATSSDSDDDDDDDSEESSEDSDVKKKSTKVRSKAVKKPEVIASSEDDDSEMDTKSKKKATKKTSSTKKQVAVLSESDASTESAPEDKKKTKKTVANVSKKAYSYALDASKLAAVAAPSGADPKKASKKKAGKKGDKAAPALEVVDLLGVESLTIAPTPPTTAAVFEAPKPLSTIDRTYSALDDGSDRLF
ncbi:hypothetical protein DYB32_005924 [Aphanomyces invadans]|uniref:Uncharacterized protein n=1 Tax=Aphanomyces invadans TaxID=157072 RepID=A0A418AT83_9STRA|nr:hypothetical protein DYB32_005924 [Aphanomyces invadans]